MFAFPKAERLRKREDFVLLTKIGRKLHAPHFLIVRSREQRQAPRLGVTVSRKVGNAVERNRVKRLLREYFRLHKQFFAPADYNIIARSGAAQLSFATVCQELTDALSR